MKPKLFSVIIATYNCGHKLAATIESVLAQPGELFELIVVDGGSPDRTAEVVAGYERRLTFVSERDRGVYDAFNKGVTMSSGRYVFFLGAGDRLRPGALQRVAESLPAGGPAFVYGNAYLMRHGKYYGGEFRMRDFTTRNICQQAIFYERSIFDALGEFDLKYKVRSDHVFNMMCFADARFRKVYIDTVVAEFEGGGISDTEEDPAFIRDLPRLVRKYVGLGDYLRYRVYLARVSLYVFRHRLAGSLKATLPAPLLRRGRTRGVGEDANSAN